MQVQSPSSQIAAFSQSLATQSSINWQINDQFASDAGTAVPGDQVNLSPAGQASSLNQNGSPSEISAMLSLMASMLQNLFGSAFTPQSGLTGPQTIQQGPGSVSAQNGPPPPGAASPQNLVSTISSALQGLANQGNGAQAAGLPDILGAALKQMGSALQQDALSTFQTLNQKNQQMLAGMAAQGASGVYQSQASVQESQTLRFSASGQMTTVSGQTFSFAFQVELQASVSINSEQAGRFSPQGRSNTLQYMTLGQQAGPFSGAALSFDPNTAPTQQFTASTGQSQSNESGGTPQNIGQYIRAALAKLTLTPIHSNLSQPDQAQQFLGLFQPLFPAAPQDSTSQQPDATTGEAGTGTATSATS